jgi:ATP-dependent Clp protease ATP-binding subunit ClpX
VVPLELTHSTYGDHVILSTADIAFVAAGAFSGFQHVAHKRASRDHIGFGRTVVKGKYALDAIAVDFSAEEVESIANFQAYGFLPELIARFTRVVPFKALSADTLKDILHTDVIARMTAEFEHEGFKLDVHEEVLDHVVADAIKRETGARGLASILTKQLEDVAFDAFGAGTGGIIDVRMVDGAIAVTVSQ